VGLGLVAGEAVAHDKARRGGLGRDVQDPEHVIFAGLKRNLKLHERLPARQDSVPVGFLLPALALQGLSQPL
jgi:hypothetical protein